MIIDHCLAEEALRFFHASPEILAILHLDGVIRQVNAAWCRLLGCDATEMVGSSFFNLVHADSLDSSIKHFEGLLAKGGEVSFTDQYQARDGSYHWIAWSMGYSEGDLFVYVSGRDVSRHVAADDELQRKNEVLGAVFQAAPIAMWACDLEDKVQFWNGAAESMFGWGEAEVLNSTPPQMAFDDLALDYSAVRVLKGLEYHWKRKDTSTIEVEAWSVPLYGRSQGPCGTLGMCIDVTEKKRREDQLHRAIRAEALAEVASGIARDFSNLLTVIGGYSEILLARNQSENAPPSAELKGIHTAAQQALFVCRQLSAFNPRQLVHPEPLNLNQMLQGMEAAVKRLVGEWITVYVDRAAQLPLVRADREQMSQLLLNLVISAYHSMSGRGDVLVETRSSEAAQDAHAVIINVRCSGRLNASADHRHLCEPFLSGMERGAAGGLALFTANEIVHELGGVLHLLNHDWGTELSVVLPALSVPAELPGRQSQSTDRAGLRVLLVEDDSMVREFMRTALEENGFEVIEAENAARAFAIAREAHSIDLLISDLILPDTTGTEMYRLLKRDIDLPVLFVSGYSDEVLIGAGLAEAEGSFLRKPFTIENLLNRVNGVLDARTIKPTLAFQEAALGQSSISRPGIEAHRRRCEDSYPESPFTKKRLSFQFSPRELLSITEARLYENDFMSDEDYDDVYREALLCLGQETTVDTPSFQPDGKRTCKVGEELLGDQEVLESWWGKKIANYITAKHQRTSESIAVEAASTLQARDPALLTRS